MKAYKQSAKLMGSAFELCIVSKDEQFAYEQIKLGLDEIKRIEILLTEFSEDSLTAQLNNNSGKQSVRVSQEFFELIERCQQLSKLSQGFFDITVGPLKKLYQFKRENFEFPSQKIIRKTLQNVGYQQIVLNQKQHCIKLIKPNMHLSFAAIGKGYAADKVKQLWLNNNVQGGYINASGDLTAFGSNENQEPWKIGIANPDRQNEILFYVPLNRVSVATSGDYEQHFVYQGQRYSHNINPKTGLPLKGIKSVSVFSPSAELSDALATAVYAMGKEKGISFVNQLPETHAIIIDDNNTVVFSNDLNYETIDQV